MKPIVFMIVLSSFTFVSSSCIACAQTETGNQDRIGLDKSQGPQKTKSVRSTEAHSSDPGGTSPHIPATRLSSTYIELDSWIYPAVERLAALGVIRGNFMGLRPWTRMSVRQMIASVKSDDLDEEAAPLLANISSALQREEQLDQGGPNKAITVDQIYERSQFISGPPLADSFHFGQTLVNDFGRPYGSGFQEIAGFESRAEYGPLSLYTRGEFQHSPSRRTLRPRTK